MVSTCSTAVGHFDGHGGLLVGYKAHRPMQHVQGYSGSHWTPALGDYALRIAPAAIRATGKQTTINKYTYKAVISRLDMYRTNVLMYRTMVLLAHLTKVRC